MPAAPDDIFCDYCFFLVLSYIPLLSLPGHGRLISSVTAFAAGRLWAVLGHWGPEFLQRG
ncbi:hypothetical protein ES708_34065 [subsurface metagenome]